MLVDKEVPRKTMIFSGMAMMICGCLAIDQQFIKSSAVWAAIMLSVIDFGSGLTQVCSKIYYYQNQQILTPKLINSQIASV